MAGVGVALGCMVHVVLAALGLAALIAAHPATLTAIRWGGAVYLLWLAWKCWTAAAVTDSGRGALTLRSALRSGFLGNLLNPKTIVFILAFLPQFVDPARGPVWQQILFLGALFSLTGMAVTACFGYAAGMAGQRLSARLSVLNKVAAVVFAGLAARLLVIR
jgi:threonine/homoserine/homoserine lactone efflux protein